MVLFGFDFAVISGALSFLQQQFATDAYWEGFVTGSLALDVWPRHCSGSFVFYYAWWLPESPRWLFQSGNRVSMKQIRVDAFTKLEAHLLASGGQAIGIRPL